MAPFELEEGRLLTLEFHRLLLCVVSRKMMPSACAVFCRCGVAPARGAGRPRPALSAGCVKGDDALEYV